MPDERKPTLPPFGLAADILGGMEPSETAIETVPGASKESLLHFADQVARGGAEQRGIVQVPELHLVTFFLDREEFGVPVARVAEILRVGDITRVPEAPPYIRGVTNVRGRILPVVEIRTRLALPPAQVGPRSRVLLVEAHGRVLGLLVDAVGQVQKVPTNLVLPPPEEVLSQHTDYITGVAKLDARLIILLDVDKALLLSPSAIARAGGA